jgi:hypothetical protein
VPVIHNTEQARILSIIKTTDVLNLPINHSSQGYNHALDHSLILPADVSNDMSTRYMQQREHRINHSCSPNEKSNAHKLPSASGIGTRWFKYDWDKL